MRTSQEKTRIWEIDALRGLLLLGLLLTHIMECTETLCEKAYAVYGADVGNAVVPHLWLFSWDAERMQWEASLLTKFFRFIDYPAVVCFFVISGISCCFSRSNLTRGMKMMAGAFVVSGFTKLLAIWTGESTQFIRFGALHCYTYCHLIYHFLLEKRSSKTLLLVSIPVFVIGYYLCFNPVSSEYALLVPFGIHEKDVPVRDFWPLFPMLGWMLVGVVLGRKFYAEKRSRWLHTVAMRATRPLQWLGRYSGFIYLAHIFIYTAVFCGIGWVFDLF